MDSDNLARVAFLVLLGSALVGYIVIENRGRMGSVVRQGFAWALIFVGMVAAYGMWGDIRTEILPRQTVVSDGARFEVPRSRDGHYYLTLSVNGTPVRFMVDTGATNIVLSDQDTRRLGIDTSQLMFLGQARTANGVIRTARVTLEDVALEGVSKGRMAAYVGDGPLDISLLGMDFLGRFEKVEIARDRLVLTR